MNVDRHISDIITRYLKGQETPEERKQLYDWYDSLANPTEIPELAGLQAKGRKRLLTQINHRSIIKPIWYKVAAAAAVIVLSYTLYSYILSSSTRTPLQTAELEKIMPQAGKAAITVSTGEVIHLDTRKDFGHITYFSVANENVQHSLTTAHATQYTIVLSDSTVVYLNADSKLSYPTHFGEGDRIVSLSGEAYFEVKKTGPHFIVKTATQSIEVLGTRFNVNAYPDQAIVKTTLAEGSVRITSPGNAPLLIQPDQQAILTRDGIHTQQVDAANIISWKDGFFVFDGSNTEEIIREIGLWYDLEVEYKKDKNTVAYTGRIPKNISLAQLLQLLNYSGIKIQAFKANNDQHKIVIE